MADPVVVHVLDYGAGNVRSVRNAIAAAGYAVADVSSPDDLRSARVLVFPGVGSFATCAAWLDAAGFRRALREYVAAGRPFLGICLGMQCLFDGSEEAPGAAGLGLVPGTVARFPARPDAASGWAGAAAASVPHMGWNGVTAHGAHPALAPLADARAKVYFVHSFRAAPTAANAAWVAGTTDYGGARFISVVGRGALLATQWHPEKSGPRGLAVLRRFLDVGVAVTAVARPVLSTAAAGAASAPAAPAAAGAAGADGAGAESGEAALARVLAAAPATRIARRVVACLDVRSNDAGDLVVTKGDQYDVREGADEAAAAGAGADGAGGAGGAAAAASRPVRNLGKPVDLAARYYAEGADEVVFLNITAFRSEPLGDAPMLAVLEAASARAFVPLTVGGGIRAYADAASGRRYSAVDVAAAYFRAGADKVSIGSDAVAAAQAFYAARAALAAAAGRPAEGAADASAALDAAAAAACADNAVTAIARVYGSQAVVVSIDPRRVWLADDAAAAAAAAAGRAVVAQPRARGPAGESRCWYAATTHGGRETSALCAVALGAAAAALGAGELLVNCVDNDGAKGGYDVPLLAAVAAATSVPLVASSGAGAPAHFVDVLAATRVEAALAAGIFHRREVAIADVKAAVRAAGIEVNDAADGAAA